MGRKKVENGPGKGNWTRGADRRGNKKPSAALAETSADKAELTDHYKKIAEARKNVIRYGQTYALTLADNLTAYIEEQTEKKKPLTIAGMVRASGMSHDTYIRYREGKADHLLYEYMDVNGISYDQEGQQITTDDGEMVLLWRLSDVIKSAELVVQEQRETACSSLKGNPAGNIFLLKAQQGFQDTPVEQRTTNNNTLILNNVATLEEAKDALKRLNG